MLILARAHVPVPVPVPLPLPAGVNTLSDPNNVFTVQCLDFVGKFSQLAKADGYRVSMVPPESYWDVSSPLFDLSLRHNYPYADGWNTNFYYHGRSA